MVNSSGTYTEKILYSFTGANGDGAIPFAVDLVRDAAGNLYGTTTFGGSYDGNICTYRGCGTVFELVNSAESPGTYTEKVLYRFTDANGDTGFPQTGLAMDQAGNLYGTSGAGGAGGWGAVYELVNSSGTYEERVIYSFVDINVYAGDSTAYPVIVDSAGNLYGTTPGGGTLNGTVFELVNSPTSPGTYTERILYNFMGGLDGAEPLAALTADAEGNLYGTTAVYGGKNGGGNVFELTKVPGSYVYNVLSDFGGGGSSPQGRLLMDSAGNLYGTTWGGGLGDGGTVFMLSSAVPPSVPAIWLSASNLTFASVVGVASEPQYVEAANSGNAGLVLDPGTITGPNGSDFALSDYCQRPIHRARCDLPGERHVYALSNRPRKRDPELCRRRRQQPADGEPERHRPLSTHRVASASQSDVQPSACPYDKRRANHQRFQQRRHDRGLCRRLSNVFGDKRGGFCHRLE